MPDQANLLTDIRIELSQAALRPVYRVATDRRRVPSRGSVLADIGTISGHDNLGQAVLMRLLTPRGELAALGHPEYGSRLHTLIGDKNDATRRGLARLYILESLAAEPRIAEVLEVEVSENPTERTGIDISLAVRLTASSERVQIGPFTLELEV